MGPQAMPEEWNRDDKVVLYVIPKTFADWLAPKMGESAVYTTLYTGVESGVDGTLTHFWSQPVSKGLWDDVENDLIITVPLLGHGLWTHTGV